jgi:hypothetical protein
MARLDAQMTLARANVKNECRMCFLMQTKGCAVGPAETLKT